MKRFLVEAAGWYGAVALLSAYTLVSFNYLKGASLPYQFLNFSGSLGIIAVSLYKKVYPSVILNIISGTIGLIAIFSLLHK